MYCFLFIILNLFLFTHSNPLPVLDEKSPEEGDLFEGDIAGIEFDKGAAQIPTKTRVLWPYGIVPYEIDPVFTQENIHTIEQGLRLIEDNTRSNNGIDCIRFVPRYQEKTYIRIINGSGCWSYVGKQARDGVQELSLRAPGCMVNAIVAHEFLHALGFWHEQSRPDRDDYIKVLYENIPQENAHNFNKYNTSLVGNLDTPYDYNSVMHYGPKSFSKNGEPTIIPLKPDAIIGQRKFLSEIDIKEIRAFYGCK